jgi:DNA-binding HxlR family transcriptional regulator
MLSKEEIISVIQELYDGKPIAFSKIKRKVKGDPEELERVLKELENEGIIRKHEVGGGKVYELVKVNKFDVIINMLNEIKAELKELKELVKGNGKVDTALFERIYNKVKDNLGYASLQAIRIEMGIGKEEFYSKFSRYIEENYTLIAGGEEGLIRKGVVYGIIKKNVNGGGRN